MCIQQVLVTRGYSSLGNAVKVDELANMTRGGKVNSDETAPMEVQDPPVECRRTRSGRTVRPPAALLQSQAAVRTPSRRTKRSVIPEQKEPEENEREPAEEKPSVCVEPEPPEPQSDSATDAGRTDANGDGVLLQSAPLETAPATPKAVPKKTAKNPAKNPAKKPRLGPSAKPNAVIPLGKPKSGRVWKDRNKQR